MKPIKKKVLEFRTCIKEQKRQHNGTAKTLGYSQYINKWRETQQKMTV